MPRQYWHSVGFGLLVASYVLILGFCARNLVLRGMSIVLIGIACNALVITLNQGMPVKFPPEWRNESWAQATVKHHPQQPGEQLLFLSDIIILRASVRRRDVVRRPHHRGRALRRRLQREPRSSEAPQAQADAIRGVGGQHRAAAVGQHREPPTHRRVIPIRRPPRSGPGDRPPWLRRRAGRSRSRAPSG